MGRKGIEPAREMSATLAAWNGALLDAALPAGVNAGRPVVFSCDEESVRLAGATLGVGEREALPALIAACRAAWEISPARGIVGLAADARTFRNATRPRGVPPWSAALALAVLAASRMDRDSGHVTQDYYSRLLELYALPARDEHPPLAGFDLLGPLWPELRTWLAQDARGERGLLELPARPAQRHVGLPISQTLFRARDRAVLSHFFARHRANLEAGWDILLAARHWGGRTQLTRRASEVVELPALAPLAASALRAAFAAWDGSLAEESGLRSWPGRLRLAASPRRIGLYLSSEHHPEGAVLQGPAGPLELPPYPSEFELPLGPTLDRLGAGRLVLPLDHGDQALSLAGGQTLLFETREDGLIQVQVARDEPIFVLSREPGFHAPDFDDCRYPAGLLPAGWTLLAAIDPFRLTDDLREAERADRPDLTLEGGLALGPRSYLDGHPPALVAGALEEPLELTIDGETGGNVQPFSRYELDGLEPGAHAIEAGPASFEFELVGRGLREAIGTLRVDLGDPPLYRNGAAPSGRGARPGVGPWVCGPLLEGIDKPARPAPVLLRTNAPVLALYRDGTVAGCSRPQPRGWQRQAGLAENSRWAVPDGADAEWLIVTGRTPRILRAGTGAPVLSAEVAELAGRYAGAPVQALKGSAEQARGAWQALLTASAEADHEFA